MSKHVASELERLLSLQPTLDPSTDSYTILCRNLEILACQADMYDAIEQYIKGANEPDGTVTSVVMHPALSEKLESIADEHPVEGSPFPAADEEAPSKVVELHPVVEDAAQVSYKFEEVREALVDVRKKGVNIKEVLREFGVEDFSAFPAGRYGELMKRLEEF
ncbi:MAG: hypothetical protein J6Y20_08820 [Lachnospiraceae bacterium]|nr:hypothetical protein [Lachnospiraceae bacterium]